MSDCVIVTLSEEKKNNNPEFPIPQTYYTLTICLNPKAWPLSLRATKVGLILWRFFQRTYCGTRISWTQHFWDLNFFTGNAFLNKSVHLTLPVRYLSQDENAKSRETSK